MSEEPTPREWQDFYAWEDVRKALECLQDAFDGRMSGPSGWRAQSIAHLRQALLRREAVMGLPQ